MHRISRRALLVQASLAAAGMCVKPDPAPVFRKHRVSSTVTEGLLLTARLTQQDARALHLEWTLVNSSHEPVVVLRHLFDGSDYHGNPYGNPDVAYVSVRDDWTVDISKMYEPVSLTRRYPCFTPVPLGDEVAAGGRISETFTLRVPITAYDPYASSGYVPDMVQGQGKAVVFHLGVYRPEGAQNVVEVACGKLIFPRDASLEAQVVLEAPAIPWSGAVFR